MATIVYTKTTCEMCGLISRREGAEASVPPVNWAEVVLTFRLEGSGWTNNIQYRECLCPECAERVILLISPNKLEGG